jgi:hypothetical protein
MSESLSLAESLASLPPASWDVGDRRLENPTKLDIASALSDPLADRPTADIERKNDPIPRYSAASLIAAGPESAPLRRCRRDMLDPGIV